MTLDTTIPLWSVLLFAATYAIAFVSMTINLKGRVTALESDMEQGKKDIEKAKAYSQKMESAMNTEMKEIHRSINEINGLLRALSSNVQLLLDGKIKTNADH